MKQEGDKIYAKYVYAIYGKNVLSAQMLGVSLLGVGAVLRFERMVSGQTSKANKH